MTSHSTIHDGLETLGHCDEPGQSPGFTLGYEYRYAVGEGLSSDSQNDLPVLVPRQNANVSTLK